ERADVNALFDRLEFGAQARTRFLTAFLPEGAPEPVTERELEQASVLGAGGVSDWLASHAPAGQRHGVVVAGPSGPGGGDAQTITIAAAGGASGHIDLAAIDSADEQALQAWLGDDAVSKAFHDAKSAIHALAGRNLTLGGVTMDIALAAYLVRPGQRSYGLAELYQRHLQSELPEVEEGQKQLSLLDEVDEAEVEQRYADAAATRARAVIDLADRLDVELDQVHGSSLLAEMELPLVPVLARMEARGVAVDGSALDELRDGFADRGRQAQEAAYEAIGGEQINLGSPKQLQV